MRKFRFLMWVAGFVYIAEGLARLLTFGFVHIAWTTQFNCWVFDLDID